jgi:surface antigen
LKISHYKYWILPLVLFFLIGFIVFTKSGRKTVYDIGQPIDSLNGVYVYFNGKTNNVSGRNLAKDNYNLGQKYQCVEFVKRYYYEHLDHKMTESYGHAKDYFDSQIKDGQINIDRNLVQYNNPSQTKPQIDDIIVFSGTSHNKYGHVAILSKVNQYSIEVIQQNKGKSRQNYLLVKRKGKWLIVNKRIKCWLRKV